MWFNDSICLFLYLWVSYGFYGIFEGWAKGGKVNENISLGVFFYGISYVFVYCKDWNNVFLDVKFILWGFL